MALPADRAERVRVLRRRTAVGSLGLLVAAWIAVAVAGAKPSSHAQASMAAASSSATPPSSSAPSASSAAPPSAGDDGANDAPLVTRQS